MRSPAIHVFLLALLVCVVTVAATAAPVDSGVYKMIDRLLIVVDSNGDRTLDAAERAKLEKTVAAQFGEMGTQLLATVLTAADADADGKITEAEWRALGKRIGTAEATRTGKKTFMVAMSDGVKLATDVHLPAGKGPFPVILERTPYNKNSGSPTGWVRQGYAVVKQDMRGRFGSEGENLPFIGCGWVDHRDGADTVDWIRRQTWCNGKVGSQGASAGGITQNLLAGAAPKGLAAQIIVVAAASLYHDAAYVGGALRESQVLGWLKGNRFDPNAIGIFRAHPAYDEYWHRFDSRRKTEQMTAAAVHVGGWFDTFAAGTVASFVARQHRGGKGAKGTQKLVMGPWPHGVGRSRAGELRFRNAGLPGKYSSRAWFDHYLKGEANGVEKLPPVAYYVMGDTKDPKAPGNQWRYAADWPIASKPTAWYFGADAGLSRSRPAAADKPYVEYTFDPADPCPTVGGCNLVLPSGPRNQNRVEARDDTVSFTSGPLAEPVEVTGHAAAKIHVSSSAVDTDLSVRFCDVYPDGKSYLMAEGMLRLRYRDGFVTPKPLTPGQAVEVTVDCWPTSIVINKGHRIRVTVTSSNHPRFDVNPGTGKPGVEGGKTVKQTNRIYCGGKRPSRIFLPVVPAEK